MSTTRLGLRGRLIRPAAASAFALAVAFGARAAEADVAELVPSDALVVVKVNNLQQVNDDLSSLLTEWGIDQLTGEPDAVNPLEAFKKEFKRESERQGGAGELNGVDWEGSPVLYLANGDLEGDVPPMVVLVPVTDFNGFLGSFGGGVEEGGVHTVMMDGDDPVYFVDMGEYAAMSPMKDLVSAGKPTESITMMGVTAERMGNKDVAIYANFQQLGPMLTAALEENDAKGELDRGLAEAFANEVPPAFQKYQPVVNVAAQQGFAVLESFLRDASAATISFDIDPEAGIGANVVAQFKTESYLATTIGSMAGADGSLLSGLPAGNYLAFGGSSNDQDVSAKIFNDLVGPIKASLAEVEDGDLLVDYVDIIETQATATESTTFGMMAPQGAVGASPLIQTVAITEGDAEQLLEVTKKSATMLPKLMGSFAEAAGQPAPPVDIQVEEGSREVNGVAFTKISTGMQQGDPMAAMMMNMVFGPEGQASYVGTSGGKLIAVQGMSDEQIAGVLGAIEAGGAPLADVANVQAVAAMLPEGRSAEFYVDIDEIGRTVLNIGRQFGQQVPIDLPDDVPPLGVAAGSAEDSIELGAFVHKDLVSAIIVASIQAQQMQGGGNMGGGL